jgi:hypothetical protein
MLFRNLRIAAIKRETEAKREKSILGTIEVQRALANGAPPVPWPLSAQDRNAVDLLARHFAQAIPVPTPEGKVRIVESEGHGGPQLAVYVPVLSERNPAAVLTKNWRSGELETDLFFFGALDGRLAAMVSRLGFTDQRDAEPGVTVFKKIHRHPRKRAS